MKLPVFLDRDGVINENRADYVRNPAEWIPIPGAIESVARLIRAGHPVAVVTNQSGIGRGYYSESDVLAIHGVMESAFQAAGGEGAKVFFCPHHPSEGCQCRKPETGMVDRARREMDLPAGGWIVGDAHSDMEMGRRSGLKTILVLTGRGAKQLEMIRAKNHPEPDYVTDSILEACDIILHS